ncbi:MAG TPA: hypothetical protein QF509_03740 [Rhodospirillales bacterium]|jgi:hypothetical protein|nr:hypothetical protein [Rhodospirillales bacterium]|tara:strand:+ start:1120 stop:1605 length:486 start_codon:yes stop_codon:yes gene_type:complete
MFNHLIKGVSLVLASLLFCLVPYAAKGTNVAVSQVAGGAQPHVGFMHTRELALNTKRYPQQYNLHGIDGIPVGKHKYHMAVTVFDTATNERISDARVKVMVASLPFGKPFVALPAMTAAGAVGYCGFFDMPAHDLYVIDLHIKRRDVARELKMRFMHEPPD